MLSLIICSIIIIAKLKLNCSKDADPILPKPKKSVDLSKTVSCSRISPPLCMGLIASSAGRKADDSFILVTGKSRKSTNAQSNNFRTEGRTCDCAFALALIFTKVAPERSGRSHLTLLII